MHRKINFFIEINKFCHHFKLKSITISYKIVSYQNEFLTPF
jgi:hypothetical protein